MTKRYVYAPESTSPVAEVDASGNTTTRYAYAPGGGVPAYMTRSGVTYRFVTDQLGSVRRVVNTETGAVAQSIDYDPYGKITQDSNENFQPFGFASGLYDSQTGLTHFGAREYDPGLGRWTSSDPIGFGGGDGNLYGYVLGDPVNWVDPDGLMSLEEELATRTVGVFDGLSFGLSAAIRDGLGLNGGLDKCSPEYQDSHGHGGDLSWLLPGTALLKGAGWLKRGYNTGREFNVGNNMRLAPYGNRGPGRTGAPHYHRPVPDPARPGHSLPDQGVGRHRPIEKRPSDESWRDRW